MAYNPLDGPLPLDAPPKPKFQEGTKPPKTQKNKTPKGGYTVQAGDNYYTIAEKLYGNQRYAGILISANGGMLRPGDVISVPDVEGGDPNVYFSQGAYNRGLELMQGLPSASRYGGSAAQAQTAQTQVNLTAPPTVSSVGVNNYAALAAQTPTTPGATAPSPVNPNYQGASLYAPPSQGTTTTPAQVRNRPPRRTTPPPTYSQRAAQYVPPPTTPVNYAALAAQTVPNASPLAPDGSFTGRNLQPYTVPLPVSPSNFQGTPPPLEFPNPARPGQATMWYNGRNLAPYPASVRTNSAGDGRPNYRDPRDTINSMDKLPEWADPFLYPWWYPTQPTGPGAPVAPPPGFTPPYSPPGGGGGRRGGGGGGNPPGGGGRGASNRYTPPAVFAQANSLPGGYRNPARDVAGLSRTGLVTWRL